MAFHLGTLKRTLRIGLLTLFMCASCFALGIATERHFGKQIKVPLLAVVRNDLYESQQRIEKLNAEREQIIAELERCTKDVLESDVAAIEHSVTFRNSYRALQRIRDIDFAASLCQEQISKRMDAYAMIEKQLNNR